MRQQKIAPAGLTHEIRRAAALSHQGWGQLNGTIRTQEGGVVSPRAVQRGLSAWRD